jgi:hypothetical protein
VDDAADPAEVLDAAVSTDVLDACVAVPAAEVEE